jgi:glycosyltransferase involved in cell wall biosynthesis
MKPNISVVLPTFNRAELLQKQLNALSKQTLDTNLFEIIVVNDGSSDATFEILNEWKAKHTNRVVLHLKNGGPAKARNAGVAAAKGEIIAFTDDDCVVAKDWLNVIHSAFQKNSAIALQGRTTTDRAKRTPLTHQIENLSFRNLTVTCNAAIKKSAFEAAGGFSTEFAFAHNEDTELSWKLNELGLTEFIPSMHVFHPPIMKSFKSQVKRMRLLASEFTLYRLQPEAYHQYRNHGPWQTIFLEVGVYHFLRNIKFSLGFYKKPHQLLIGLGLQICSQIYLLSLIPYFIKESKQA